MIGRREYFRTLWRLLRAARENPLVVAGSPMRSGWVVLLFTVAQVLACVGVGLLTGSSLILCAFQAGSAETFLPVIGEIEIDFFIGWGIGLLLAGVAVALFGYPLNLLAFSNRWMTRERLEELLITPLSAREMAFGSVFWAVVVGSILPLGLVAVGGLSLVLGEQLQRMRWGGSFGWNDEVWGMLLAVFILLHVVVGAACASLKVWFHMMRHKWPILLVGPLVCVAYIIGVGSLYHLGMEIANKSLSPHLDETAAAFWVLFVSVLVIVHLLHSAGKLAPSLFIRAVDMEAYRVASFVANSGMRVYSRDVRRTVWAAVRNAIRPQWVSALMCFSAGLVLAMSWSAALKAMLADGKGATVFLTIHMLPLVIAVSTAGFVLTERKKNRVILVNGGVEVSLLRLLKPLHLLHFLPLLYVALPVIAGEASFAPLVMMKIAIFILFLLGLWLSAVLVNTVAVAWWLRPGWWWWLALLVYLGVPWILGSIAFAAVRIAHQYRMPSWPSLNNEEIEALFVAVGVLVLYRGVNTMQQLYQRTVIGLPYGECVRLKGSQLEFGDATPIRSEHSPAAKD